ncbi:hypothetical protein [Lysinibacillus sp. NPDC093216]|uniref:hypothetical protein n=1 Tax=Lysinibacillus sp. NPDC093216 TaxID=3390576 RepID=UPI003CFD8247
MVKIGHIVICESFGSDEQDRKFIINPKVMFFVDNLKSNIDFVVSIGIYGIQKNPFPVAVEMLNPDGDLISRRERELSHPNPEDYSPNLAYSAVLNVGFKEVLIQQNGIYTIKAIIEGDEKTLSVPILQRQRK